MLCGGNPGARLSAHDEATLGKLAEKSRHWARIKKFFEEGAERPDEIAKKRAILAQYEGIVDIAELSKAQAAARQEQLQKRQARIKELLGKKAMLLSRLSEAKDVAKRRMGSEARIVLAAEIGNCHNLGISDVRAEIEKLPVVFKPESEITETLYIDFLHSLQNPDALPGLIDSIGADGVVVACKRYVAVDLPRALERIEMPENAGRALSEKFQGEYGREPVSLQTAIIASATGQSINVHPITIQSCPLTSNVLASRSAFEAELTAAKNHLTEMSIDGLVPDVGKLATAQSTANGSLLGLRERAEGATATACKLEFPDMPLIAPVVPPSVPCPVIEATAAYLEATIGCVNDAFKLTASKVNEQSASLNDTLTQIGGEANMLTEELAKTDEMVGNLELAVKLPARRLEAFLGAASKRP